MTRTPAGIVALLRHGRIEVVTHGSSPTTGVPEIALRSIVHIDGDVLTQVARGGLDPETVAAHFAGLQASVARIQMFRRCVQHAGWLGVGLAPLVQLAIRPDGLWMTWGWSACAVGVALTSGLLLRGTLRLAVRRIARVV